MLVHLHKNAVKENKFFLFFCRKNVPAKFSIIPAFDRKITNFGSFLLQIYGQLFYLLQTEPYYVAQLTRSVSLNEIDGKNVIDIAMYLNYMVYLIV